MAYPDDFTYAIDGTTEIIAAHINNLEIKVGITGDTNPTSLDYRVAQLETAPPADVALLPGRVGGQYLRGGTASGENLTLGSTAHATKGKLLFGNSGNSYFEEILQNLKVAGHIAFGNTSILSAATVLFIDETTSQQYPVGIFNYLHPEYSGTPSSAIGFGNIVNREAPGDFGTLWSGYFTAWAGNQDSPQKTINDIRALFASAGCVGDYNTVSYLCGLSVQSTIAWNMVSCDVTEMHGGDIGIFIGSGDIDLPLAKSLNIYATQGGVVTGTLGTLYGIYINDHSLLGFSTHYNFYSVGVASRNKFEGNLELGNTSTAIASLANTVRLYGKDVDFLPFITDHAALYIQPEVGRPIVFDKNCMTMFQNWTNPTNYTRIDIGYNDFDAFWGIKATAKGTGPTLFGAQNGMVLPSVGMWSYDGQYAYIGWAIPSGSGVAFSNEVIFDWTNKLVQFSNLFSGSGLKLLLNSELEVATGDEIAFALNYEVNKATSGDAYGLKITPTLTTVPGNVYNIYSVGLTTLNLFEGKVLIGPFGAPPLPISLLSVSGLPVFPNNAAALGGGLLPGDFYKTTAVPGPPPFLDPVPVCVVV
jgi:hypothetical protein